VKEDRLRQYKEAHEDVGSPLTSAPVDTPLHACTAAPQALTSRSAPLQGKAIFGAGVTTNMDIHLGGSVDEETGVWKNKHLPQNFGRSSPASARHCTAHRATGGWLLLLLLPPNPWAYPNPMIRDWAPWGVDPAPGAYTQVPSACTCCSVWLPTYKMVAIPLVGVMDALSANVIESMVHAIAKLTAAGYRIDFRVGIWGGETPIEFILDILKPTSI